MILLAGTVVVAFGLFLAGFSGVALVRPALAGDFLLAFAQSARVHYAELAARLVVGTALVAFAPETAFEGAFRLAGWVVVGTTVALACVPWRWHRRFAEAVVPPVLRYTRWLGCAALVAGTVVLYAVVAGASVSGPG